jgi:hypothetical protein
MTHCRATLFTTALFFAIASQAPAETLTTVTTQEPSKLVVQEQNLGNGAVAGVIRNLSDDTIQEVTLLIQHSWHWNNEFHPGPPSDNPGRSEFQTISKSIAPRGALEFQYTPRLPLPARDDGYFTTSISVHEYTAIGEAPLTIF